MSETVCQKKVLIIVQLPEKEKKQVPSISIRPFEIKHIFLLYFKFLIRKVIGMFYKKRKKDTFNMN